MSPETKNVMNKREAGEYLGLSVPTIDRLMKTGDLRFVKLLRSVRFRREDLDAFLAAHVTTGGPSKKKASGK